MKFMEKVRAQVARQNRNLAQLSRMTGVPQQRFQDWDNPQSNRKPTLAQALAIAKALHVSLDYLADDEMTDVADSFKLSRDEEVIIALIRNAEIDPKKALKAVISLTRPSLWAAYHSITEVVDPATELPTKGTWAPLTVTTQSDPKPTRPRRTQTKKADKPKALPAPKKSDEDLHGKKKGSNG